MKRFAILLFTTILTAACGAPEPASRVADATVPANFCIVDVVEPGANAGGGGFALSQWSCQDKAQLEAKIVHVNESLQITAAFCAFFPGTQKVAFGLFIASTALTATKMVVTNMDCDPGAEFSAAQQLALARANCKHMQELSLPCSYAYSGSWVAAAPAAPPSAEQPTVYSVRSMEFRRYTDEELQTKHGEGLVMLSIQVCHLETGCASQLVKYPMSYLSTDKGIRFFQRTGTGQATIDINGSVKFENDVSNVAVQKATFFLEKTVGPPNGLLLAIASMKTFLRSTP